MKKQKNGNGEGSFRIVNGKYNYRFTYVNEFGEKKRKSFSAVTKEECLVKAEDFFEKMEKKNAGIDIEATIPDILRRKYEDDYAMNYIGEQGYARNLDNLMVIEKSGLGKLPIVDITELQMNLFLRSLTRYSESVIKKIYQQVKAAYRIAEDKNIVENNLMESTTIRRPRSSKKEKVVKGFTQEEQTRFLDVLNDFKVPRNRNDYKL